MTHLASILWYLFFIAIISASYHASLYAIKVFDRKWKATSEAEQAEADKNK